MAGNSQQIARILQLLLRQSKGKLSPLWAIALLAAAGVYLFFEPALEARLGFDLPGAHSPSTVLADGSDRADAPPLAKSTRSSHGETESGKSATATPSGASEASPVREPASDPADLSQFLTEVSRNRFESPAGLLYTPGSQQGHRLKHLMKHAEDDPDRVGQHGVFDDSEAIAVVKLVDEAYEQALTGKSTKTSREGNRTVYTVNLGRRVGYIGGQSGGRRNHPSANYVRLVVEGERLITAFPVRP